MVEIMNCNTHEAIISFSIFSHQYGGHLEDYYLLPDAIRSRLALVPLSSENNNCFETAIDYFFKEVAKIDARFLDRSALKSMMSFNDISAFERKNANVRI